ncbi:hypothetical protein SDC9_54705 [bioreactor metagenome]|uniref:Uncharacterized protein n=1 Tax=bioreactor metagenome TaxID=1076179 RepID=A0A644X275_9ZZZZ
MRTIKRFFGTAIMKIVDIVPPKSAVAGLLIGFAAMLATTATSCEPQVMCYDPAPPDTIPQDTVDSTRHFVQPDTINDFHEKK